jgi:hypothetical protein
MSMLAAGTAHAQLGVSAGIEYFEWTEDTDPIEVEETGALFALGLEYTQQRPKGLLFAYRGRFYVGDVDYDGALLFAPSVPVTGTTSYLGMSNEAQLRYRFPTRRGIYSFDLLGAAGYDFWERELSDSQSEDFRVAFIRFGFEVNPTGSRGWTAGLGAKYPVWTEEDAHLEDLGFDDNEVLEPGRGLSVYGQAGFRFSRHLALIGYLDGYNFLESDEVAVSQNGAPAGFVFQPASMQYNVGLKLVYLF